MSGFFFLNRPPIRMTRSNFKLTKDPFSANDNFQELQTEFEKEATAKILQIPRDSLHLSHREDNQPDELVSYMVSGTVRQEHHDRVDAPPPKADRFANWTKKAKIGRRKITRSLGMPAVRDLKSAWHHARTIGGPVNRFITFRPHDIDDQNPEQRIATWTIWRNKLAQFARDHRFDFTSLWTRESERHTGRHEHLHVLMHVPQPLQRRFDKLVESWCSATDEIDVRACTYRTTRNQKGGEKSVLTYISKNSPQAGRYLHRTIQLGGPIFGKRYGLSTNLTARARARHEVVGGLRRDLGLVSITAGVGEAVPEAANDIRTAGNGRNAA